MDFVVNVYFFVNTLITNAGFTSGNFDWSVAEIHCKENLWQAWKAIWTWAT